MTDSEGGDHELSGFEIQMSQLRRATKAAGSAATQAKAVHPGTGLEAMARALPGGVAAISGSTLASAFNERTRKWADEIDKWTESVTSAAAAYAESDDSAREAFGR